MPLVIGLLLFPMVEIAGFVVIGPYLGTAGTLGFVLASTLLGSVLLRREGTGMLARLGRGLGRGTIPALDGVGRMGAALLLIVPGFISSALGLLLLIPAIRHWAGRSMGAAFVAGGGRKDRAAPDGTIIDGDFREVDRPGPRLPPQP